MSLVANARMYAVTPEVEADWRALLDLVFEAAGARDRFTYLPYPAPRPLEELWRRPDLGCVFMCGYPVALGLAAVTPLAAPVPRLDWAEGRAVYRSDLIVRREAPHTRLEDTFAGRVGWTVEHSQSGFNALRRHLLAHRRGDRPVYAASVGPLVTARRILDEVTAGGIDVGPLDAYWHALLARHRPDLTAPVRVLDVTATAPMPAFVAGPAVEPALVERLKTAFAGLHRDDRAGAILERLLVARFEPVTVETYAPTLAAEAEARAAGYLVPA